MTVFAMPVLDATVIVNDIELFKGRSAAELWAPRLSAEIEGPVTVEKIRSGWVLCGSVDGYACIWGVYGQRLKRIARADLV